MAPPASAEQPTGQISSRFHGSDARSSVPAPVEPPAVRTVPRLDAQDARPTAPALAKPPAMPILPTAPTPQPAPKETAAPVAPEKVTVVFLLAHPRAKQVSVCGDFNGWSLEASPMELQGDGHWQAVLRLNPGRYQYKFVIDGEWMPDPQAKQNVFNPFGTLNSVVEVR